jgi:hypothetical protein
LGLQRIELPVGEPLRPLAGGPRRHLGFPAREVATETEHEDWPFPDGLEPSLPRRQLELQSALLPVGDPRPQLVVEQQLRLGLPDPEVTEPADRPFPEIVLDQSRRQLELRRAALPLGESRLQFAVVPQQHGLPPRKVTEPEDRPFPDLPRRQLERLRTVLPVDVPRQRLAGWPRRLLGLSDPEVTEPEDRPFPGLVPGPPRWRLVQLRALLPVGAPRQRLAVGPQLQPGLPPREVEEEPADRPFPVLDPGRARWRLVQHRAVLPVGGPLRLLAVGPQPRPELPPCEIEEEPEDRPFRPGHPRWQLGRPRRAGLPVGGPRLQLAGGPQRRPGLPRRERLRENQVYSALSGDLK